ncbi:MAG: hypothetical protein EXR99_15225 [Gemmataceae bacterium]|nr:hypothetical protein [Gemmataceae bacterium]
MYELKPLNQKAIPLALMKGEHYRLLADPEAAESICHDILAVEPENQEALVLLLLSLTDQFDRECTQAFARALDIAKKLTNPYQRVYYQGLVYERRGRYQLSKEGPNSRAIAFDYFHKGMAYYGVAEPLRPPQNDDAILRWNTCAREIMKQHLEPIREQFVPQFQE